jgi:hypothetical protein
VTLPPVECPAVTQRGVLRALFLQAGGPLACFDGLWRRFASDVSAAWSGW